MAYTVGPRYNMAVELEVHDLKKSVTAGALYSVLQYLPPWELVINDHVTSI